MTTDIDTLLTHWFGELNDGWTTTDRKSLWFGADKRDDDDLRERFGGLVDAAVGGKLTHWRQTDNGSMALILLTDQLPRAINRGTAAAFAGDAVALSTCKAEIDSGLYKRLPTAYRFFYCLPLEHSENLADQKQCVRLFEELRDDFPQYREIMSSAVDAAVKHLNIIAEFGRFPHRNGVLGRPSIDEEIRYLSEGGESFGQSAK